MKSDTFASAIVAAHTSTQDAVHALLNTDGDAAEYHLSETLQETRALALSVALRAEAAVCEEYLRWQAEHRKKHNPAQPEKD